MSTTRVYYNDNDPQSAEWLRQLVLAGAIPVGEVDDRSILDVQPSDVRGYTQCHFFAGIGGWAYALALAQWAEEPVWTGSAPCQPFSDAGKKAGFSDERHLWPHFYRLIRECHPPVVFGEQVASKSALAWFDVVQTDLEAAGYAVGAADLCAAGVGAPHIRQRLYFVAHDSGTGGRTRRAGGAGVGREETRLQPERLCDSGRLADGDNPRLEGRQGTEQRDDKLPAGQNRVADWMAYRTGTRRQQNARGASDNENPHGPARRDVQQTRSDHLPVSDGKVPAARPTSGFWGDSDWLLCRDDKWRAVEPGTFPLAHGIPARVGLLRGYGNAIVPQVAAEFVKAYLETRQQ